MNHGSFAECRGAAQDSISGWCLQTMLVTRLGLHTASAYQTPLPASDLKKWPEPTRRFRLPARAQNVGTRSTESIAPSYDSRLVPTLLLLDRIGGQQIPELEDHVLESLGVVL